MWIFSNDGRGGLLGAMTQSYNGNDTHLIDRSELLLSVDGDTQLLGVLTNLFLKHCPQQLADIGRAIERKESEALARTAHALRGGAGHFLTRTAYKLLTDLEMIGKEGRLDDVEGLLEELEAEMLAVERELSAFVIEQPV